jgi:PAS domain-containing protein
MNPSKKADAVIEMDTSSHAEWQEPPTLTVDERGMICDCSEAGEKLFGYSVRDLVWQPVSKLLPELSEIQLVKNGQFNPQLGFLTRCGQPFLAINRLGNIFLNNLHFVLLNYSGKYTIRVIVQPC